MDECRSERLETQLSTEKETSEMYCVILDYPTCKASSRKSLKGANRPYKKLAIKARAKSHLGSIVKARLVGFVAGNSNEEQPTSYYGL
jgi:hypothetical protein